MKRFLLFLLFALLAFSVNAVDKKEKPKPVPTVKSLLKDARQSIKNKRDQARHEQTLQEALKREGLSNADKAEIRHMQAMLNISINDAENLKAYLKQKYDTAAYFNTLLKASEYALQSDSLDALPDEKGRQKFVLRSKNREILLKNRSNIYNGGRFFLRKNDYSKALPYFVSFLKMRQASMLENEVSVQQDGLYPTVSMYAMVCSYNCKMPQKALTFIDEAMNGVASDKLPILQEYKVRCYSAIHDTANWVTELHKGCKLYPNHDYFFTSLLDFYESSKSYDEGISLCDSILHNVGDKPLYYYAKSLMYLHKEQWQDCIDMCDSTLCRDSLNANAHYNRGISYVNLAMELEESVNNLRNKSKQRKEQAAILDLYRKARPSFETLRQLLPDDQRRWAPPLYRIYLNLNCGKEFEEMEQILKTLK